MARWYCAGAFNTVIFGVRVLEFLHHASTFGDVIESDFSSGTIAVALASALVGVWRTSSDLLWGKVEEHSAGDGSVRLNSSSGGECPA